MENKRQYHIKHSLPGRLRVATSALIGHKKPIGLITTRLSDEPGITHVRANYLCGSIILHYDPKIVTKPVLLNILEKIIWEKTKPSDVRLPRVKETTAIQHSEPRDNGKKKRIARLWNVAGGISVGIGVVGIFLPLLPTVPLFLLAGFCYLRGSPRFYNRLISFGPVGRLVDNFQRGKGLPAKTKRRAIVFMWLSMATSIIFFLTGTTLRLVLLLIGIIVTLYILGIKTADPLITTPKRREIPAKID
ncbi:MAG: DUF454 domain-containing protein [Deltaproteobacteria bacterium]|nr:DUF454 domain-containing protein [Deltaproteobacteria bacterium]